MTDQPTTYPPVSALEQAIPNEEHYAQKIADRFKETLAKYYEPGSTKRMFHPKMHGLLRAELVVEPGLPTELQVGLFKSPKTYPAWVRLSNAKRHPSPDKKNDMRGMAIKLFDVEGEKLIESEKDAKTHDFLLVTTRTLQTKSVRDFQKSIYALTGGPLALFFFSITHPGIVIRSIQQISKCSHLFEKSYFSTVPSKFGAEDRAVKYAVFPQNPPDVDFPDNPEDDFLRQRLSEHLTTHDFKFDFMVQFQENPDEEPIEDPRKEWKTLFRKVATLHIPKQTFDTPAQHQYGENLSFSPWHCIEAHRPLGGANRARKLVYEQLSAYRHERNGEAVKEPDSIISF